jgi:hypothetical protein
LSPKPIDAEKLFAGMSELLRGSVGETIRLALARWPDLKVLFTTGDTKYAIVHNAVLDQRVI